MHVVCVARVRLDPLDIPQGALVHLGAVLVVFVKLVVAALLHHAGRVVAVDAVQSHLGNLVIEKSEWRHDARVELDVVEPIAVDELDPAGDDVAIC